LLRTVYFIRTIENIIKQTPWEVKLKIRNTCEVLNKTQNFNFQSLNNFKNSSTDKLACLIIALNVPFFKSLL
jgi:hypothetical protein